VRAGLSATRAILIEMESILVMPGFMTAIHVLEISRK
jgi:hypothetical protein